MESERGLWAIRCARAGDGCTWRLRACLRKKTLLWQITQYDGPHTCVFPRMSQDHSQLDSKMIARELHNIISADPAVSVKALGQVIQDRFGYKVHYKRIWDAKRKAISNIFGEWDASYQRLPKWLAAVVSRNPGTKVEWRHRQFQEDEIEPPYKQFQRVFWAFSAFIEGFKHCRPILQIDGTFLYGKYKGKLLIATSIDADGHIFPVAFAVVEKESIPSWAWFLRLLRKYVTDRDGICLISDRHVGIIEAVQDPQNGWAEPRAHHRFCLRHVASNFNEQFKNKTLKTLAYRAGVQHQQRKFDACMAQLAQLGRENPRCVQYLRDIPKEKWTQAYDGGKRYGWMTTNIVGKYFILNVFF
jgi:hypothetical protein